jgi:MscS family membrane protein
MKRSRLLAACRIVAGIAVVTTAATAQKARQAAPARDTMAAGRVDSRSPRAAIADFLSLTRRGQYAAAAQYMALSESTESREELARKLKAVFDQRLWIELEDVSPLAAGDTADGLGRDREQIGMVSSDAGVRQPVQLQRRLNGEPTWVFAKATVDRVDQWYDALEDRWLRDRMPVALQRPGPFGIDLWQWVLLGLLFPIALGAGWILGRITIAVARRAARGTETQLDDRLVERAAVPLLAIWSVIAYRALVEFVGLSIGAEKVVGLLARAGTAVFATWFAIRATHVLEEELPGTRWATDKRELRSLAPLLGRVFRVFLVALGAIIFVAQFGYSVTTLIAGLGIGGIAVALAMQKTLEHVFGSVAIGLDQPIHVGDWVKVGEVEGEVEAIGLRSTRIRTMERSVVALPNGRLAEMHMENFGVRDRILLKTTLALTYQTTPDQIRRIRDEIETLLEEHSLVWPDKIIVRFKGFSASSLDIEVIAWVATRDFNIFRAAREEIYLKYMQIVRRAGSEFAYPTSTVFVKTAEPLR